MVVFRLELGCRSFSVDDDEDIVKRWKETLSLVTRSTWGTGVKFNISTLPIRASTSRGQKETFIMVKYSLLELHNGNDCRKFSLWLPDGGIRQVHCLIDFD